MKVTDNKLPVDVTLAKADQAHKSTEDFSLILDKAVAKTQEDALTYERDLLKHSVQPTAEDIATVPFAPQQLLDLQSAGSTQMTTPILTPKGIVSPGDGLPAPTTQVGPALQPVTQQVFQQLTKVFDKPGVLPPGISLRELIAKQRQLVPTIPFDQLYSELVKQVKTMKQGSTLRLKLALEPDKLGSIDVYMVLDNNKQLAIMFAANDETRKLLENSGKDLSNNLTQNGYTLNDMQFMNFSGSGHQSLEYEFNGQQAQNLHNDAEMLNILGQPDIINSVNAHLASAVVNHVA